MFKVLESGPNYVYKAKIIDSLQSLMYFKLVNGLLGYELDLTDIGK